MLAPAGRPCVAGHAAVPVRMGSPWSLLRPPARRLPQCAGATLFASPEDPPRASPAAPAGAARSAAGRRAPSAVRPGGRPAPARRPLSRRRHVEPIYPWLAAHAPAGSAVRGSSPAPPPAVAPPAPVPPPPTAACRAVSSWLVPAAARADKTETATSPSRTNRRAGRGDPPGANVGAAVPGERGVCCKPSARRICVSVARRRVSSLEMSVMASQQLGSWNGSRSLNFTGETRQQRRCPVLPSDQAWARPVFARR